MSTDEIRNTIIGIVTTAIAYLFGRRQSKATLNKTEAEAEQIRVSTKIHMEDHNQIEKDKILNKIEILSKKVDAQDLLIDELKSENKKLKSQCDELKAELTLYKTIKN